jgi:uncharacterized protein YnzC (UPF0291/DUF896 family)
MSIRQLRARLDRLSRSNKNAIERDQDSAREFKIDPALAKALRDDYERLCELLRKRDAPSQHGGPLTAAEKEEEPRLRAHIDSRARAIKCPADYGPTEARKDNNRLDQLYTKRLSPPSCGGGKLTDAEDTEEAQLRARVAAYDVADKTSYMESPEGRALKRINELEDREFRAGFSTAEQNELDTLRRLYPHLPSHLNDPLLNAMKAVYRSMDETERENQERVRARGLRS